MNDLGTNESLKETIPISPTHPAILPYDRIQDDHLYEEVSHTYNNIQPEFATYYNDFYET